MQETAFFFKKIYIHAKPNRIKSPIPEAENAKPNIIKSRKQKPCYTID